MNDTVIIGKLGSSHGVAGWLKLQSYTDPPEKIFEYSDWKIQHSGTWISLKREAHKIQGNQLLVKFAECTDREVARTYTNNAIRIMRSALPNLKNQEYYWHDLIGLSVYNQKNILFGTVEQLMETEKYDLLVIQGDRLRYVPFTKAVVQTVDLNAKKIVVEWDELF